MLDSEPVRRVLEREHERARADRAKMAAARPAIEAAKAAGEPSNHLYPKDVYLAIEPAMGRFLYLTAKAASARNIVEFGTSFGISTIYLATAAMETGGRVTGSELEDTKAARVQTSLADAGLSDVVDIRVGDALETLSDLEGPVDLLFLDGWKDLYIPVLDLLEPRLAPGALVLADNIRTFPDDLAAYVEYVNRPGGPYTSVILPFESGLGYSLYRPDAASN